MKHTYGKKGTYLIMIFLTVMTVSYGYEALTNRELLITSPCDVANTNIPLWDYANPPVKHQNSTPVNQELAFGFDTSVPSGPLAPAFEKPTERERLYQACKARDFRIKQYERYVIPILLVMCLLDFLKNNKGLIRILRKVKIN